MRARQKQTATEQHNATLAALGAPLVREVLAQGILPEVGALCARDDRLAVDAEARYPGDTAGPCGLQFRLGRRGICAAILKDSARAVHINACGGGGGELRRARVGRLSELHVLLELLFDESVLPSSNADCNQARSVP